MVSHTGRPCLRLCCNTTEHNTIIDLFLCNDCERTRGEAFTKLKGSVTHSDTVAAEHKQKQKTSSDNAVPKGRRKKSARQCADKPTESDDLTAVVNRDAPENALTTDVDADQHQAITDEHSEAYLLKAEVHRLSGLVGGQTIKLNFVLSFLQKSDELETTMVPPGKTDIQPAGKGEEIDRMLKL
jgi:hypothetical protein